MRRWMTALLMTGGFMLAVGCSRSPLANFYTLSATAPPAGGAKTAPSLTVDRVTLPELVDRPQFVIIQGDNRVEILEMQQWAESLGSAIPRVLADNLSRQLGLERVAVYPAGGEADYHLHVDFQRFEATTSAVTVDALWTVRSGGGAPLTGRSRVSEPHGEGYDSVAAAYSRALAAVSGEIARGMGAGVKP